jgi:hypothetical protein
MISSADGLAGSIREGSAMARVDEDIYERAARSGRHTPEKLEWMRRNGIIPSTGAPGPLAPLRPRWLAFLIRILRFDPDDAPARGGTADDPMLDDRVPPLPDLDEVFERAARTGWYTPEQLDSYRRNGIRPATGRAGLEEPVKQRPAWLAFLLRTVLGPAR